MIRYIAKVIKNNDSEKKGRVQIYIPELMKDLQPSLYPWAYSDLNFTSNIPNIGDMVWVWFEDEEFGTFKKPFYQGVLNFENYHNHNKTIGSMTGVYPDIKYLYLKNGVALGLNSNQTEVSIIAGSAEIFINSSGEIHIKSGEAVEKSVKGETLIQWLTNHTHPTGVGPSGPPTQASTLNTCLSQKVKNS